MELARMAEQRLTTYSYLGLGGLTCEADDGGQVVIRGSVSSYYHKQVAQEIVRRVQGVRRIDNQLAVRRRIMSVKETEWRDLP